MSTNPAQTRLVADRPADLAWMRRALIAAGYRPALITDESMGAMLDHFPDPDQALAAWQSIAQGKPYRP